MNDDENKSIVDRIKEEGINQLNENARAEAERYLKKRMNWTPRNEDEEDLYEMGLQNLLDNYN